MGTNRSDSKQTVTSLIADFPEGRVSGHERDSIDDLLRARGLQVVDWAGWCNIDRAEVALGAAQNRERAKISDRWTMLRHALR